MSYDEYRLENSSSAACYSDSGLFMQAGKKRRNSETFKRLNEKGKNPHETERVWDMVFSELSPINSEKVENLE